MHNRILVLDDDPGILKALDISLTYCGFQVRPMLSGDNVFRMIDDFEPNLIILDYMLSGKNGSEICKDLKNDSGKKNIPIIMVSAHLEAVINNAGFCCDSFMAKPFDLNELVSEIKTFINPDAIVIK